MGNFKQNMSKEIKPRYEILYSDLRNHLIGDFLVSRDFKILMTKIGAYESWQKTYEEVKSERNYFFVGTDHVREDNLDTLVVFINASHEIERVEQIVTAIIVGFIDFVKTNDDFNDVIEAMKLANFSEESINDVMQAFENHIIKNLPEKEIPVPKNTSNRKANAKSTNKKDVFIVHGHNEELKEKVARTLEKLKLNPIILHEQSDEGQTIIEKFEKNSNVDFAIVLLTYDDHGNTKSNEEKNKRARQNVILELGYFIAKLGRSKVMPLYEKSVELPSDISGVLYTLIDDSENWKFRLVKELKAAGFNVDANDII